MLPAALVDATIAGLEPRLKPGDIVIDGGNSYYRDDVDRAKRLSPVGCTTSIAARAAACGDSSAATA